MIRAMSGGGRASMIPRLSWWNWALVAASAVLFVYTVWRLATAWDEIAPGWRAFSLGMLAFVAVVLVSAAVRARRGGHH
jgi:hypothetical protein